MATLETFNDPFDVFIRTLPEPDPDIQVKRVHINSGVISRIDKLTYDTFRVVVKVSGDAPPINGTAGQYATIQVPGARRPRSYSFALDPEQENPDEHTFFIRLVHGGKLSSWLAEDDRTGEHVIISGPMGKFGIDDTNKTMVCIAGGSGMSAIHAIVQQACREQRERDCYFFYGARTQSDLYLVDELKEMERQWNSNFTFKFIPVLSEEAEDSDWDGPRGFVTQYFKDEYLDKGVVSADNIRAFFCGPPPMIDHGVEVLEKAGLASEDIRYDKFEDARSPAPVVDNTKCVLCDECLMVKPVANCLVEATNFQLNGGGTVSGFERVQPAHTSGLYYNSLFIDENECIRCYACVEACPHDAISPDYDRVPTTLRKIS
jgi:NAD(P)H-flavin reductase